MVTAAGDLPAKWIFHAVGPVYRDGQHGEPSLLASCYSTCLRLAEEHCAHTVSFPGISTGVYGYPMDEAARIAIDTVSAHLSLPDMRVQEVLLVLYGNAALQTYSTARGISR